METAYIETTIPSLYTGRPSQRLVEAARQNLTRIWWDHHRHEFDLVCSQTVLDQCAEGEAEMAKRRGELLDGIPLLELTDDVVALRRCFFPGKYMTIIEQVRSQKEAVAARHDFNVAWIVAAARERQENSGRRVIRQGEQSGGGQPDTRPESK